MDKLTILLCFLIGLFAIGSWIDLNGLWIQIPLLINNLPEGSKLPTYVVAIAQLANIAPLLYMSIHYFWKFQKMERITIYFILSLGSVCCALLSIFWNHTLKINVFGQWHESSVVFFILVWLLSMIDTTSSVTFLPYLINYPRHFITALYVGEGLSGFLPGIAGLIQGVGGDPFCMNKTTVINGTNHTSGYKFYPSPRFSISMFFVLLCVILILCLISFTIVDNCSCFHKYRIDPKDIDNTESITVSENLSNDNNENRLLKSDILISSSTDQHLRRKCICYILLVAYINFFTNGILPSIQNYTLMPYSITLYHIIVNFSQILNPLACLLTLYQWKVTIYSIITMTVLGSCGTSCLIFAACKSPVPLLNISPIGEILVSFCWFFVSILFSFEKTLLALELQKQGHIWLQLCGAMTQIGSTFGSILIFILVVILNVFQAKQIIC